MRYFLILLFIFPALLAENSKPISPANAYAMYYHKRLPYRLDVYTTLVDLLDIGDRLFYRYHINDTALSAPSRFSHEQLKQYEQKLYDSALKQVCNDKQVVEIFDSGVVLWHGFYTQKGRLLFDFKIDKVQCENYKK